MQVYLNPDLTINHQNRPYVDKEDLLYLTELYDPNGASNSNHHLYDRPQPSTPQFLDHCYQRIQKGHTFLGNNRYTGPVSTPRYTDVNGIYASKRGHW
jgi:hypothetical protein